MKNTNNTQASTTAVHLTREQYEAASVYAEREGLAVEDVIKNTTHRQRALALLVDSDARMIRTVSEAPRAVAELMMAFRAGA